MVVTFDLWFSQMVDVEETKQQLKTGLQQVDGGGLVIDKNSIQIIGEVKGHNPDPDGGRK